MKRLVFIVFSSILVFAVTIFFRLGGHKDVDIEITSAPDYYLLYQEHTGAYHKIASVITDVEALALKHNLTCQKTFGEYLDNPQTVDERRLRSLGGCLYEKNIDFTDLLKNAPQLKLKKVNAQKYVRAVFLGAPSIGPFKVYPKVENFMKELKLQSSGTNFELYTIKGSREAITEYLFPIIEK